MVPRDEIKGADFEEEEERNRFEQIWNPKNPFLYIWRRKKSDFKRGFCIYKCVSNFRSYTDALEI